MACKPLGLAVPPSRGTQLNGGGHMRRGASIALLCVFGAAAGAAPQDAARFHGGVDIVALNVVVTDGRGKLISGLSSRDFAVLEDGIPQDIACFAGTPVPVDLALLLDTSASMTDKIATVQKAAVGFTEVVRPGDRISVVDVKESVRVVHPLDENVAGAHAAIRSMVPRGSTSLYNGLYMTLKEMMKQRRSAGDVRRQALVVLSDGDDTSSLIGFDDVMDLAKQSGIGIYTITLQTPLPVQSDALVDTESRTAIEFAMKALAQETGARAFFPAKIEELAGVYGTIAGELATQYSVGYVSKNPQPAGAYRRVTVRIERPEARARTRAGYIATPPAPIARR